MKSFDNDDDLINKWLKAWTDDSKNQTSEDQKKWEEKKQEHLTWIKKNKYVLLYNGIYYTHKDICEGRCKANGVLVNMGYRQTGGGRWKYNPDGEHDE